jgi:(2Fe-2S) ferredoxin
MLERLRDLRQDIQEKVLGSVRAAVKAAAPTAEERASVPRSSGRPFCDPDSKKACLTVCAPRGDCACDAPALKEALEKALAEYGLAISVGEAKTGCSGQCTLGPFVGFPQKGFFYLRVTPEAAREVVRETLGRGRILFPYLSVNPDRSYRTDILYDRFSGLLAAIDDTVCMVEVARYFLAFEEGLSCGKCVPCRLGMKRMEECLDRIIAGEGTMDDLEQIGILCETMIYAPHCQFAMASSKPVLSAVTYFKDEFVEHIEKKECRAGVCAALVEIQKKKAFRERMAEAAKKKKKK